jgi:sugar phosphate isomerase/epimerase
MPLGLSSLFLIQQHRGFPALEELLSSSFTDVAGFFEVVDNDVLELDAARCGRLKEFSEVGVRFTVHSTYDGVNIACADEGRRRASLAAVKESMDWAAELEALNVVVHPGVADEPGMVEECFERNLESLLELKDHSSSRGVRMSIENDIPHRRGLLVGPKDFERLYKLAGGRFPLVLDVGHAHLSGQTDGFLQAMKDEIVEVHVHDNEGERDQHLALGEGRVDFSKLKPLFLKPSILFTVESVYDPFGSYSRLEALRREALAL